MINPTCHLCVRASEGPFGGFDAACRGCNARHAARSPGYRASAKAGWQTTEYRALLRALGVTHDEARQAAADDWKKERT